MKLHVPNHMGLRNPVFTNVISLVDYAASMSEITQVVVSAITGERVVPTTSSTPAVQTPVVPDEEPEYEQPTYETNANYYDEEEHQEKVTDKIKNFFSNFFE